MYVWLVMIYLDHNATTPVAETVLEKMLPVFSTHFANPNSTHHRLGRLAATLVDAARERVAAAFGASPGRVVFTSGSTEAINLAIKGLDLQGRTRILVGATEHKAVLEAAESRADARVERVPVHPSGRLDIDALEATLADDVALVAVMAVNNETGVINDVAAASELARAHGCLTLCDATQAVGRIELGSIGDPDMFVLSGHKIYGPKGVGGLVANRTAHAALGALISGGGQERGLRSGTLNTPGIVGLGAAVDLALSELPTEPGRQRDLRNRLEREIAGRLGGVHVNGSEITRACNTANLRFDGADGEAILTNLDAVAASTGSACQSAVPAPSHVLLAMGLTSTEADQSLRFSLGRETTDNDITAAVEDIVRAVERIRSLEAA